MVSLKEALGAAQKVAHEEAQQELARQLQQSKQGSAGGQLAVAATVCKQQVGKQC